LGNFYFSTGRRFLAEEEKQEQDNAEAQRARRNRREEKNVRLKSGLYTDLPEETGFFSSP
jgi:hypothetical protein